ncbi:hypothetical protein [Amnibacterium setariae]|uniref:hypothetical protein n=1 Tax=Amnibacterium setariae TaxID=2306585 RepID=UPI001F1BE8C4|nr:hypothetical protein [Amnibacterium setariae]
MTSTCVVPKRVVSAVPVYVPSFAVVDPDDGEDDEKPDADGEDPLDACPDDPDEDEEDPLSSAVALATVPGERGLKSSTPAVPSTVAVITMGARRMRGS